MPLAEKARCADYVIDNSGTARGDRARACARSTARSSSDLRQRQAPAVSPRRNARATARAPRCYRPATRGTHPRPRPALPARPARWSTASWTWWRRPRATSSSRSARGAARSPRRWPRAPAGSWPSRSTRRWPRRSRRASPRRPTSRSAQADARQFDYRALRALAPDPGGRVLVVGNLPYSVGKPILAALVEAAAGHRRDGADAPEGGGRARGRRARAARPTARSRC